MDGGRKPDPKPENENELTDEEIIDLTQVLEGGDDDDIIDLNEVLEQPGQAPDETDEGIIPLVDAIPAEKATTLPEDTDEAIIDLGETATTMDASISDTEPEIPPLSADETPPEREVDEDVIDLLDMTALDTHQEEVPAAPSADDEKETAAFSEDTDEDIIDLEDVTTTLDADIAETDPESGALPADEGSPSIEEDEDIIDLEDVTTTLDADIAETDPESGALPADEGSPSVEEDEDIIDLEDVTTTLDADITETDPESGALPADEGSPSTEEDEDIIDLLDVNATDTTEEEPVESPATEVEAHIIDLMDIEKPAPEVSEDEELADLESRAEAMLISPAESTGETGEIPYDAETPEEAAETAGPDTGIMALDESESLVENGQAAADPAAPPEADTPDTVEPAAQADSAVAFSPVLSPEPPAAEPSPPTDQQVEAALERVIEKIYGEKIEQMMIQTIEKTVKREIEKIKNALIEDTDGMVG
jgi:hypothetical protein